MQLRIMIEDVGGLYRPPRVPWPVYRAPKNGHSASSRSSGWSLRYITEPTCEMMCIVWNRRAGILAQYKSALCCDVGNRVSITRNERPHRQFAVEPAHPRLRVHAAVVRNIRYLRVAFFVER